MSKKERKDKDFIHRAYYEGGATAMKKFIADNLIYPEKAKKQGVQGAVKIQFEINHKGKVHRVKVISGLGYGCDEEAIRLAELLEFTVPKTYKLKVGFKKKLSIHFKLKKVTKPKQKTTNIQYNYVVTSKKSKAYAYSIKI